MGRTNPERAVRDLFAALDSHNLDAATATLDPDFEMSDHLSGTSLKGREAYRKLWEPLYKAFPDLKVKILNMVAMGDKLAAEIMATGTFNGPLGSPPEAILATGRHVEFRWAAFAQVNSEGLIAEGRVYGSGLRQQLGVK